MWIYAVLPVVSTNCGLLYMQRLNEGGQWQKNVVVLERVFLTLFFGPRFNSSFNVF